MTIRRCKHCGNDVKFTNGQGECYKCGYVLKLGYTHVGDCVEETKKLLEGADDEEYSWKQT